MTYRYMKIVKYLVVFNIYAKADDFRLLFLL